MFNSFFQSLISRLSVAGIGFLVLVVSAKFLGVSSRGEISLFLFNIALLQIITEVFTGYHLLHFIGLYNARKIYLFGLSFVILISIMGNSLLLSANKLVEGYEWQAYLITFLVSLNTFHSVIVLGQGKLKLYYLLSLFQPFLLLTFLLLYVMFIRNFTFIAYVYPLLISFTAATLYSFLRVWKKTFLEPSNQPFDGKSILKNGISAQTGLLLFVLGNKYSYYFLEPGAALGIYSAATSFTESVLVLVNAMLPVYLSKITTVKEKAQTKTLAIRLCKLSLVLCALALLFLNLVPENWYLKILGDGFKGIKEIVLYYSPAVLCTSVYVILSHYFSGKGQAEQILRNNLPGFVLMLLITPFLVKTYNQKGAAIAAVCVYALNTCLLAMKFIKVPVENGDASKENA